MIALWLNDRLRKDSEERGSLDERMVTLVKDHSDALLTTENLLSTLSADLSPHEAGELRSFVESGTSISLPSEVPDGCGDLVREETSTPRYVRVKRQCTALVSRSRR
jgi:hypothetical protein